METLPPVYVDEEPSLSAPQDQDTGVSLAPAGGPVLSVPDDIATVRAKKTQEGLGRTLQKSTEDIKREISQGRENILRQEAASKQSYENSLQKQKMLIDLANQKGGPLNEDEVARIMDPYNPANRPVDPDSVVEKAYSRSFVNSIQTAIDSTNSTLKRAQAEIPQEFEEAKDKGSEIKQRMEYAGKIKEDLGIQIHNQTWLGWGADQAKDLSQLYVEAKMRGQNSDVGVIAAGLLLGDNLQEQADKLLLVPDFDTYKQKLKDITTIIAKDNPTLAMKFAEYVEGVPQTDRYLDNFFTIMAIPDILGISKLGFSLARKLSLSNRTNVAVKQLLKDGESLKTAQDIANTPKVGTTTASVNGQVARSEALGDASTAAVERSTDNIVANIEGKSDPVKIATDDSLLTNLNQDKEKIAANPGKLSREQVVRIQDAYDATGKNILQRLMDTVRINRIPMAVATENAVRIIKDAIKDYYPGIRNAILDVSNPLYEPKSNTYWHEVTFGNFGGDLFSNPETARNFAGLHGFSDTRIVEGYGKVTPVQTEKMLERQAFLKKQIVDWEQTVQRRRAEARDTKLTDAERVHAKEQAEGIIDFIKKAKGEADDLSLKLRNNETYNHVKRLENEITQHQIDNKDLRSARGKDLKDEHGTISKEDIDAAVKHNQAQIKAKAQEINAIKQGKADVIAPVNTVEQHGVGFKIVLRRPLVETDKAVRDLLIRDASGKLIPEAISTSSQTGLKSLMNAAIGKFRGADDTLALNESIQRKIGTYSQSLFKQWANEEMKYIRSVASGVIREDPVTGETIPYWKAKPVAVWNKLIGNTHSTYDAFVRTLDHARDALDPDTGKPGYFFESPGKLEDHYWKYFDRAPTFAEHQAYFSFVRLTEGDRIFREVAEFRNRARLGTEQFSLSARGPDGKTTKSNFFDGISRKNFPGGDDVLMVMGRRLGDERLVNLGGSAIAPNQLKEWREAVQQGRLRIIEVYAAEHTPLKDYSEVAGNNHVRYILTDTAESKPIEYNHVNRRGGGHFEYDYEHYIKQAKMYHQYDNAPGIKGRYRSVYYGDTTFMPVDNRVMGRDIGAKLNEVQRLIREGKLDEAKAYTEDKLPIEFDKLHGMFKSGDLDMNEPFVMTTKGKSVLDMDRSLQDRHGKAFKDGTKSGSLNSQFQTAFNTERDSSGLQTFVNNGTADKPLYDYAKADMVDPITTMNRALNRIINSTFMDDYKIYAVEHWLREAEQHLELKEGQVNASPFWAFEQANDKSAFRSGTPIEVINNILSNRYKIKQFTGVPSSADTAIHAATQMLVDQAYAGIGAEGAAAFVGKVVTMVPLWMLGRLKDPVTFARSMTFNFKLGLFNPAQLLVQAQTHAAILSIEPIHGTSGVGAALLHGWSSINGSKEILNGLDKYASKLTGFKPGEWLEAREVGNRTGFFNVAGEYANLDNALKTDFIGNDFKGFLKAGRWFFEKGEQTTRVSAWYTAFREFRSVNPTKALTRDDIGAILNKADLLTINMSRASNSALNSSVLSLTTQFLNYQIRLAELFMGNRITPMAKFRMATFYAALYGAPSAIGLTGLPMANSIREEAMQRGYVVGENWIKTAVMEGLPAVAMAHITGNQYNIGARYGSPGFTQLSDALKSDHAWYQLLAGASGTTLINTLTAGNNFFHVVGSMLQPNNKDKAFPLKMDDFVDVFKEISSVNQAWKAIAAINTGKWMSKNEGYIGDVSKANAVFMAITGLNPQAQDDLFLKADIRKSEVAMQKFYLKEFIQEYRRYLQASKDNNKAQAADFIRRADTMLEISGYPIEKKVTAYSIAAKGYESQIDSNDFAFAFKNVPRSRSDFLGIPTPFTTQSNIPTTRQEQFRTEAKMKREAITIRPTSETQYKDK